MMSIGRYKYLSLCIARKAEQTLGVPRERHGFMAKEVAVLCSELIDCQRNRMVSI
jgi:hypothetical protein